MAVLVTLVLAAAFGAGDQYLGSFSMHPWMAEVSLLSAPWLALAFVTGCRQRDAKKAVWVGAASTFAALVGYMLMTLSPMEGAHPSAGAVAGFLYSSARVFAGAVITGPLFGWLGFRWRNGSWLAAALTAALVCLEPLAHSVADFPIRFVAVAAGEVAVGVAALVAVSLLTVLKRTQPRRP